MATYYSEEYQATENGAVTAETKGFVQAPGYGGRKRFRKASFVLTPATGDILRIFRVRAHWRILSLRVCNADLGTNAPIDIGVYRGDGGAVVDADLWVSALELGTAVAFGAASLTPGGAQEQLLESGTVTQPRVGWSIGQLLAVTTPTEVSDGRIYDICATVGTVVAGASGFVLFQMDYLAGD